jgi:type I restriction enzyme S subunit
VSLDTYPRYKNSNIEWIGEVPAHWRVASLRWYASIQGGVAKGKNYNAETPVVDLPYLRVANVQDGFCDLSSVSTVTVAVSEVDRYRLHPGDVLMNEGGDNDKLGRGAVWQGQVENCLHQNHVFAIRPNRHLLPYWLSMFTRSAAARSYFYLYSKQSTNLASISSSNVMSCPLPFPSTQEQRQILGFLDHETAKIDALIREQERLIELLQEKRQAVISHAVTKGLDPDVPMKDSGVEWLGEVPERWNICPIKFFVSTPVTDGPHETPEFLDEGILFISAEAVSQGEINFSKAKFISPNDHSRYSRKYKPKLHDIFMVKSGATTGTVAINESDKEFNIWSPLAVIRCSDIADPHFILHAMRSQNFQESIVLSWSFGTQQNIGMGVIENLPIALPPLQEQLRIKNYLNEIGAAWDSLELEARKAINLLKERRSALISAAVTGKIDVRNWQPPVDESAFDEDVRQAGMEATA